MLGQFVIENKRGEVVRTLNWENPQLSLVYRNDTRRVESLSSVDELNEQEIPYTLLAELNQGQVKQSPVSIAGVGTLKWLPQVEKLSPLSSVVEEESGHFRNALKWTSGLMLALLLLVMLIGHFMKVELPVEEPQRLVKIVPRPVQVVAPITHKVVPTLKVSRAIVKKHPAHKVTQQNVRPKIQGPKKVALNSMGALAVLGNSSDRSLRGGIKLDSIQTTRGPGLGGTAGSGGVQSSLYAKGLVAAPLGPDGRATGAGGYGTHGRGGGQPGYGKMSLVGSSSAFFQPMEREAIIEGGLDREQIAEVIQRHLGQIRFCYEQGLQARPELNGRVAIRFFISGSGTVNTASVSNTSLHSNDVEGCIVGHLKSWKFPEPRGGVVVKVTYPFLLKRVSQQS